MTMVPWYVPAVSEDGSAVTCKVAGIVPLEGATVSQEAFPEEAGSARVRGPTAAVKANPGTIDERVVTCWLGLPPATAERLKVAGEAWYVTAPDRTSRMRKFAESAM